MSWQDVEDSANPVITFVVLFILGTANKVPFISLYETSPGFERDTSALSLTRYSGAESISSLWKLEGFCDCTRCNPRSPLHSWIYNKGLADFVG